MIRMVYEDPALLVCIKPVGLLSEPLGRERCLPALLQKQTRAYKIEVIHRLDRNVGGLMLYSKSSRATAPLAKMMAAHRFTKEYLAVARGTLPPAGRLEDWLVKDRQRGKVFVARRPSPEAKAASLDYRTVACRDGLSLVRVTLHTGRTHQIRVQLASRGFPLVGDTKYGDPDTESNGRTPIALWSYHLGFIHPLTGRPIEAFCPPEATGAFGRFAPELRRLLAEDTAACPGCLLPPEAPQKQKPKKRESNQHA